MKYSRLGNSGLVVSKLCFGAGALGVGTNTVGVSKNIPEKLAMEIVGKCLDSGITLFDSSDIYLQGQSETLLGKGLGARRKDALIQTKTGVPLGPREKWSSGLHGGLSYRRMIQACDDSLKRLGTDYIDIYYCHGPDRNTPMEESMRAWEYLVSSGRVRYVGVSNYKAWQCAHLLGMQKNAHFAPVVCNEVYYSLLGRHIEFELKPMAEATGLGIVTYQALAGGFLTGKYSRSAPFPEASRGAQNSARQTSEELFAGAPRFEDDYGYIIAETVVEMAKGYKCTPAQLALAWTISKPWMNSAIFGISKMEHLLDSLGSVDVTLSEEDIAKLDKLTARTATAYTG